MSDPTDYEIEIIEENLQGPPGPRGANGNTIICAAGPPTGATGVVGDFYINTTSWFIYGPKSISGWPTGVSIIGPQGNTGQQGPGGNTVLYGSGAPSINTGADGNFYIDTSAWYIYGPKASGTWPTGVSITGPAGGRTIWSGTGAPSNTTTGANGDFYIRTDTWFIYGPKAGGVWPAGVSIVGPTGATGATGATGPSGSWSSLTGKPTDFMYYDQTANISKGYNLTPNALGNIATPFTPDPTLGNYQFGTNHQAFTWNAPASDCAITILVTNDATAGAITFSGYTVASGNAGDNLDTTNGHKFLISIVRINGISTYMVKALQ